MRRAETLLALLLALAGCDAFQPNPITRPDAGVHQAPLSVIATDVSFPPASITLDFQGNIVAAHADHPILTVLDPMSFADDSDNPVTGAADPWTAPQLELGAEGQGVLFATSGAFFNVNMTTDLAAPFVDAGLAVLTWTPRLDAAGVAYADLDGGVHRLDADGGEDLTIPAAGDVVESLAATLDGHVLILTSTNGVCSTIRAQGVSGAPLSGSFGFPPCTLALAGQAGEWLWVMGQTDGGAEVQAVRAAALGTAGPTSSITGMSATQLVVSGDGTNIAMLGAGPTYSVAVSTTANLFSLTTPGDQGPWRLAPTTEISEAASGVFDDSGNLYVADPGNQSIYLVQ